MDTTLLQENNQLKNELNAAKKYIEELEVYKTKYLKQVEYEIKLMTEHMPDGQSKDDFIKLLLKTL